MTMAVPAADFAAGTKAGGFDASWRRRAAVLLGAALLIVVLFHGDATTLATIWWTSTTFGHCLFISPVIAWLVWQRRSELAQV
ncbi:MAG: exosortase, partial [Sphingomonas bacterium]|nr:exosortase [Sphingomonas bacterium]